jgi:hypothetical protein
MTIVVILNVLLSTLVVTGIMSLLGWGVVTDRGRTSSRQWRGLARPDRRLERLLRSLPLSDADPPSRQSR